MNQTDPIKILMVDDLPEKIEFYRSVLKAPEIEIVAAGSGAEALSHVLANDFAVILLDVGMPGMDGFEAAALIRSRERSASTPILFVTANADELHALHGYDFGAADYILTPVVPDILRTKVRVFVDLFRLNRQAREQADWQLAQARTEQARLAAVLENAADFVGQTDAAGRIIHVNAAGRRIIGRTDQDSIPADLSFIQPRWASDLVATQGFPAAVRDGVWIGEAALLRADGVEIPVSLVILAHKNDVGGVESLSLIASDITERKCAEQALRAGQERLRMATKAADLGVWVWDLLDGDVTWENERPYEIFGLPKDAEPVSAARFASEFLHKDDLPSFEAAVAKAVQTDAGLLFVGRFRRPDGELRWLELTGLAQRGADGQVRRIVGTAADVTQRQRAAEQAQRISETNAKFRTMFEQAAQFAAILALDGTVLDANRLCLDACGFTRDEIIGKPFWECGWWNRSAQIRETIKAACGQAATGKVFQTEMPYFVADGSERTVHLMLAPVTDDQGRILYVAPTGIDITERKLAQEALRESQQQSERQRRVYAAILNNTPDFAYVFDLNHRFSYANDILLKMFGRTAEEALGKDLVEIGYEPWHAELHSREIDQVVATKQPIRGEVPFNGAFGRRIYDYIFVPVFGADGNVEAVAGTTRDVTERKEAESALNERESRLRAMFGQAAVGIVTFGLDGAWMQVNERMCQIVGRTSADLCSHTCEQITHPED